MGVMVEVETGAVKGEEEMVEVMAADLVVVAREGAVLEVEMAVEMAVVGTAAATEREGGAVAKVDRRKSRQHNSAHKQCCCYGCKSSCDSDPLAPQHSCPGLYRAHMTPTPTRIRHPSHSPCFA